MLTLKTKEGRLDFGPGGVVEGVAGWSVNDRPESVQLFLMWYTIGKGDEDAGIVEELALDVQSSQEEQSFKFTLPDRPYSFEGALIALQWAIELVTKDPDEVARIEIIVSPWVEKVVLPVGDYEKPIELSTDDD